MKQSKKFSQTLGSSGDSNRRMSYFLDNLKRQRAPYSSFNFHNKNSRFATTSLFLFNEQNKFRRAIVWLTTWQYFEMFIILSIIVNSVFLGMQDYINPTADIWQNNLVTQSEFVFTIIFAIESLTKIISMGFICGHNAYLKDAWNWLDFIVVITGLLTFIPSIQNVSVLRTFRLFRPLRSLTSVPSMRILVGTLLSSISQLGNILGFAIFVFLIFAILGISLWAGSLDYRCRDTPEPVDGDWVVAPGADQICGVRQCPAGQTCGSLVVAADSGYVITVDNLYRDSETEHNHWGVINFDYILPAFLTIFQCITMEGWTPIMYNIQDAYNHTVVSFYFVFCVIVCSLFLLNLTIAVMLQEYDELDKRQDNDSYDDELRQIGSEAGLPDKVIDFIIENDNIRLGKPKKNQTLIQQKTFWKRMNKAFCCARIDIPDHSYYREKCTKPAYRCSMLPCFNTFIMLIIMINTILLALERYPEMPQDQSDVLFIINIFFIVFFTFEVIIKLVGLGVYGFARDKFNLFDTIVVIISYVEIAIADGSGALSALRAFRLFRVFKIFRFGDLRVLLDSIAFTLSTIGNYVVLLLLFIYVYALLGMQFFAGVLKFDANGMPDPINGNPPRENFDNIYHSATTIFLILIGDNWNSVMYDCMRTTGSISTLYFVSLILFGNIIMLNLFLAILLGNFDKARIFQTKKKVLLEFVKMRERNYTLGLALDRVLGDASDHVKEKVIKGDLDLDDQLGAQSMAQSAWLKQIKQRSTRSLTTGLNFKTMNTALRQTTISPGILDKSLESGNNSSRVEQNDDGIENPGDLSYASMPANQQDSRAVEQFNSARTERDQQEERQTDQDQQVYLESQRRLLSDVETEDDHPDFMRSPKVGDDKDDLSQIQEEDSAAQAEKQVKVPFRSSLKQPTQSTNMQKQVRIENSQHAELFSDSQEMQSKCFKCMQYLKESSLFIFHQDMRIRKLCQQLVIPPKKISKKARQSTLNESESGAQSTFYTIQGSKIVKSNQNYASRYFDYFIIVLIMLSSLLLCLDTPLLDPSSLFAQALSYLDIGFTFLFLIEAFIKIIALGFVCTTVADQSAYIRNYWNILDFLVVGASLLDFYFTITLGSSNIEALKSLKSLRALRALRPLRMISRNEGLRLVVNALFASIPSIKNVMMVCGLFILIFAIMGINFFRGSFYSCQGLESLNGIVTKSDCLNHGGNWENARSNFDNIFIATQVLFEMMTTEGWLTVMYSGIDHVEIDKQPQLEHDSAWSIFFIAFMVIGSMFILNLFVGVVIDNFNKIKESEEMGDLFVTAGQRNWIEIQQVVLRKSLMKKEVESTNKCRVCFKEIQASKYFEIFIQLCIVGNTLIMSMRYSRMSDEYESILELINNVFNIIFNIEFFIKVIGLGKSFFSSAWNRFDMVVVIGTDIGAFMKIIGSSLDFSAGATVVRAFRILRILRLIRSNKNMRILLDTIVFIIPQITNVMSLIFLLFFIYSALGINQFSTVMYQEEISEYNNFRNFGMAMLLLMRCSTGEDWHLIMTELANAEGYNGVKCEDDQTYQEMQVNGIKGCGNNFSYAYFISFMILISMVIMNLSVAAVIEGLDSARKENTGMVSGDDLDVLLEIWKDYDTEGTGWIDLYDLVFILYELPKPLGLEGKTKLPNEDDSLDEIGKGSSKKSKKLNKSDSIKTDSDNETDSNESEDQLTDTDEEDFKYMMKKQQEQIREMRLSGRRAISIMGMQDKYIVNEIKKIYIRKSDALKILNRYQIPMYGNNKIHFKDVSRKLIEIIFSKQKVDFELSQKAKDRIKSRWKSKHPVLKKEEKVEGMHTGLNAAGGIIFKWIMRRRAQRALAQNNRIASEEKDLYLAHMQSSEKRLFISESRKMNTVKVKDEMPDSKDFTNSEEIKDEEQIIKPSASKKDSDDINQSMNISKMMQAVDKGSDISNNNDPSLSLSQFNIASSKNINQRIQLRTAVGMRGSTKDFLPESNHQRKISTSPQQKCNDKASDVSQDEEGVIDVFDIVDLKN